MPALAGVAFTALSFAATDAMVFVHAAPCACAPVTVTAIAQLPPAASVPPVSAITLALTVTIPPQPATDALAAVIPAGSVSVNATPDKATPTFGLLMLIVSAVVCPTKIVAALKFFVMLGGIALSISVAELLAGTGSAKPTGTATLAVFDNGPVAASDKVPLTVNVAVPPLSRLTAEVLMSPTPDAGQLLPALATHVQLTPVTTPGRVSLTAAPLTANGPLLLTKSV